MHMDKINVKTGRDSSYDIIIDDSFSFLKDALKELYPINDRKVCIISDTNVGPLYLDQVKESLNDVFSACTDISFNAGEASKNLDTIKCFYEHLIKERFGRNDVLIALGGGVTGDMCGFTAATFLRGVDYIQIPTSLLSQVDSSIGGKTGVDNAGYKNVVGLFNHPEFVYLCSLFLRTLDEKNMLSGGAEMLKLGIIGDRVLYRDATAYFKKFHLMDYDTKEDLESLIMRAVKYKCRLVEKDYREHGPRRVLNLGHTFAHAIEKCSPVPVSHGNAVSIGTVLAARIGQALGKTSPKVVEGLVEDFTAIGLPVSTSLDMLTLLDAIAKDRRSKDNAIDFVIPVKIGSAALLHLDMDQFRKLALSL